MPAFHLAELNIATLRAPLDSPVLADFVGNLERINALAEASDGFVWRLKDDAGDATAFRPFGDEVIVNVSVWRDVDALRQFMFQSAHAPIMRRRAEWFLPMEQAHVVLWWVPAGHTPDLGEAADHLDRLRREGPGPLAFGFRSVQPPPSG